MGFEDEMADYNKEQNASPQLTEDERKALEKAEEFARLNKGRPVFFDGTEMTGEYKINGKHNGSNIIIDVCDDEVHPDPTHTKTVAIDLIYFDKHAAKADQARNKIGDPKRVEINRARQFAEEHERATVSIEGRDEIFMITGLTSIDKVEVRAEYELNDGTPASLTTSVRIEDIAIINDPGLASKDHNDDLNNGSDNITHLEF